jgi:fructose-1,6-bisphosphatase/inositol monophosphatase family enzyme
MKPWLEVCRESVGDIKGVLAELPTRVEREPVLQIGEGGDDTTAIDAAAETAVVHRLEALDEDFTLVSEELGEREFGAGAPWRVVCDPIDGSLIA